MTEQESQEFQEFLAIRKEAGLKIDPATAEVDWEYGRLADPYGIRPDLPEGEEYQQIGRVYLARSPGSDIWVWFGDLPEATDDALWEKHKHKLAFPAGLDIDIPDAVQSEFATVVERDWKRVVSFNAMRAALRRVLEAQLREFFETVHDIGGVRRRPVRSRFADDRAVDGLLHQRQDPRAMHRHLGSRCGGLGRMKANLFLKGILPAAMTPLRGPTLWP
jgi:hypothetical protein